MTYGGRQGASADKIMQRCGCGVVACCDVLRYLHEHRNGCKVDLLESSLPAPIIPHAQYEAWLQLLRKKFFPIVYPVGTTGIQLAIGLNRIFRKNRILLRARWKLTSRDFWQQMENMLEKDLPVIISIGPDFPCFWQKKELPLYRRVGEGVYLPAAATSSHFLTVTGLDDCWMQVSSWGWEYFIRREEYEQFARKHSIWLFHNMILLREID